MKGFEKRTGFSAILEENMDKIDKTNDEVVKDNSKVDSTDNYSNINLHNPARQDYMTHIDSLINSAAQKYEVEPELVKAVMKQESNFNPYALSSAGARGLMQLMPATADILGVENSWDITQNIDGGTHFLKDMIDSFGDVELALAAYNAGPGNVKKYKGVPPFDETVNFIDRVMKNYEEYKQQSK